MSGAHQLFAEMPLPAFISGQILLHLIKVAFAAIGQLSLLLLGKSIHSKIVKFGVECSIFFAICLIDMYGKRGVVEDAIHEVYNKMKDAAKNVKGYVKQEPHGIDLLV